MAAQTHAQTRAHPQDGRATGAGAGAQDFGAGGMSDVHRIDTKEKLRSKVELVESLLEVQGQPPPPPSTTPQPSPPSLQPAGALSRGERAPAARAPQGRRAVTGARWRRGGGSWRSR